MANQDGTLIVLKVDGTQISGLTTQGLDMSADEIDTTTKDDGSVKKFLPGEFGGTLSAEGKEADTAAHGYAALLALMQARTAVAFIYGGLTANDVIYSGTCFVTTVNQTGPKNAERTWAATFRIAAAVVESSV